MSNRYKGGIISATPPTTTGGETGVASGAWTLEQQMQAQAAGNWPIQPPPVYIEDVFSTWLYTGTGAAQTITNGINLSGKGGLVWNKLRSFGTIENTLYYNHFLTDTIRGAGQTALHSNNTDAQGATAVDNQISSFNNNGFTLTTIGSVAASSTGVSWTFREQPKFFDCVTYTGNGTNQTLNHNLGAVPGCMIVKATSASGAWYVYHRSAEFPGFGASGSALILNSSAAVAGSGQYWAFTSPTATQFTVGAFSGESILTNIAGVQYVAYLFAHNAGGFGPTETDNVISCGSYTGAWPSTVSVNLGYEPQWVLVKNVTTGGYNWLIQDNMRGMPNSSASSGWAALYPNTSGAEQNFYSLITPTATGFIVDINAQGSGAVNSTGDTYIYIAIRRGPMATPTTGTSVFSPNTQTGAGTSAGQTITTNFPVDLEISSGRNDNSGGNYFIDRLRGGQNFMRSNNTNAEVNFTGWTPLIGFANNTGITDANYGSTSASYIAWNFRRAPGFFDEVCYSGTGVSNRVLNHNLGVPPELMVIKSRNSVLDPDWLVQCTPGPAGRFYFLNSNGFNNTAFPNITNITSTTVTLDDNTTNDGAGTYVAYFFASCPGVSKVGAFTGTGATQVIDCGFTTGARFVLIKSTNALGDWYVWDSARGIVAGNDPYLTLNTTAAEVTGTDWVDTAATGFELSNAGGNLANSNGVTYIFLAVA